MAAKRPNSDADQKRALYRVWRHHLEVTRVVHHHKRYPQELHAFAPRIFNQKATRYRIPDDEDLEAIDDTISRGSYTFHNLFRRSDFMARQHNEQTKFSHPFTSSPQVPPTIGLYFYKDGRCTDYVCFAKTYGATLFMNLVTEDQTISWLSDNSLELSPSGVVVTGAGKHDLENAMEHELTPQERQFVLPAPYPQQALSIVNRAIPRPVVEPQKSEIDEKAPRERRKRVAGSNPRQTPEKAPSRPSRRLSGDPSAVSIGEIAQSLKIAPREARHALRQLKITKPAHGRWEWPQVEAADIAKTLQEHFHGK